MAGERLIAGGLSREFLGTPGERPYPPGLTQGRIRRMLTELWQRRLKDAGSLSKLLDDWCPECSVSNRSKVVSVSPTRSSHQTFRLGSLPSGEALMSLR